MSLRAFRQKKHCFATVRMMKNLPFAHSMWKFKTEFRMSGRITFFTTLMQSVE